MPQFTPLCNSFRLTAILVFAMCASAAPAQVWTASTGTIDESSASKVQFDGGRVSVRSSLTTGTVTIRYNVLPVGDLAVPLRDLGITECRVMRVRFLDNGSGSQVTVTLKRVNVKTGAGTTLLRFDSNSRPAQSAFQEGFTLCPEGGFNFSFGDARDDAGDSVYYLEAVLSRTAPGGTPGLASIRIYTLDAS